MKTTKILSSTLISMGLLVSCSTDTDNSFGQPTMWGDNLGMGGNGSLGFNDEDIPDFDRDIKPYSGQLADDAANDIVGDNADIYWEANKFKKKISVKFNGQSASIESDSDNILSHIDGAHVVIDML